MSSKILIAASSKAKAKALAQALKATQRKVDYVLGSAQPRSWGRYRLLVCEVGTSLPDPTPYLARLPAEAHAVLILPTLDVKEVSAQLADPRVNHLLRQPVDLEALGHLGEKLATGGIFGMERMMPAASDMIYRRFDTYADRCKALDELAGYLKKRRLRGRLCSDACAVAEELLMNAMYQAPVDEGGCRLFADLAPRARLRRRTPRPVSLRYLVHQKRVYLSVRDRYGSLDRQVFAGYLQRCVSDGAQLERKHLGAGIGLYLVTSLVQRLWINVLPGGVTEFICVLASRTGQGGMDLFSYTSQRRLANLFDGEPGYGQVAYIGGED